MSWTQEIHTMDYRGMKIPYAGRREWTGEDGLHWEKFSLNAFHKTIRVRDYMKTERLYDMLKQIWKTTGWVKYHFPMVGVQPHYFEIINGWDIQNIGYLQNAGIWIEKTNRRYVSVKGLGICPVDLPRISYSRDGRHYFPISPDRPWRTSKMIPISNAVTLYLAYGEDGRRNIPDFLSMDHEKMKEFGGQLYIPWLWEGGPKVRVKKAKRKSIEYIDPKLFEI